MNFKFHIFVLRQISLKHEDILKKTMNNSLSQLKSIVFKNLSTKTITQNKMAFGKIILTIFLILIGLSVSSELNLATATSHKFFEYHVKAEFLERITKFIDWPEGTFSNPNEPFIITLVGENPFGPYLRELAKTRKIKNRRVILRQMEDNNAIEKCHMLFIAKTENKRLDEILSMTGNRPILIMGDGEKLARRGTHISLYKKGQRIRFNINLGAARKSGLVISSKLLRLATVVYGGNEK